MLTLNPRALSAFGELIASLQKLKDKPLSYSAFDPTGFREEAETIRELAHQFGEALRRYVSIDGNILADEIERAVEYTAIDLESAADDFSQDPWEPN